MDVMEDGLHQLITMLLELEVLNPLLVKKKKEFFLNQI